MIHPTAPAPRCCRCGGWTGRGTLCLRLPAAWPCPAPLTDTRCTHVRAGLLLLLAVVRPTTGSLLPSPPAACSVSTRGAPRADRSRQWAGHTRVLNFGAQARLRTDIRRHRSWCALCRREVCSHNFKPFSRYRGSRAPCCYIQF